MKGVLLAGDKSTRLRPVTHTVPKQLAPIANKPGIQYAIEELNDSGITDIGVGFDNKGREAIWHRLGDGSACSVRVSR